MGKRARPAFRALATLGGVLLVAAAGVAIFSLRGTSTIVEGRQPVTNMFQVAKLRGAVGLAALDDKGAKKKGVVGRWKKMDKDGDGELTKQEAKDGQDKFSDDKVDDMWPLIDKDKNGRISFDEFVSFMKAKKKEADGCWERMDKDGDGELTKQEVKDGQDKFSDDKVDDMWPLLDKDKSGTISVKEFFAFMKAKANGSVVIS